MTITPYTTLAELAYIVCTALHKQGYTAILTGGGAATYYAPEAYQSRDLDFVFSFWTAIGAVPEAVILDLGFTRKNSSYSHPDTTFTIDFPTGPLAVGEEEITTWQTHEKDGQVLHILSPTDCVRDRLAWYFFNSDFSALEQALAVATRQRIDLRIVRKWAEKEGESAKFSNFEARLHAYDPRGARVWTP